MNTIRATFFLIALTLAGGCASVAPKGTKCAGADLKKINIVYQRHSKITVAPSRRVVERGQAIDYRVKGVESRAFKAKGTKGPGSASYGWLDAQGEGGTTGDGNSHIVCVDRDQDPGDYEYLIEIDGVGALDPVVHVD
jgi:hypothetical protein